MIKGSVVVSPDRRRLAYVARAGKNRIVTVDWNEQNHYGRIEKGSLVFSLDSQRLAYASRTGTKKSRMTG